MSTQDCQHLLRCALSELLVSFRAQAEIYSHAWVDDIIVVGTKSGMVNKYSQQFEN
jgi:hypothetical protein